MGIAKRELERRNALAEAGVALCVAMEVLHECDDHPGTYYAGKVDVKDGYRLASQPKYAHLTAGFASRREMTDSMKLASDSNPAEECPLHGQDD